MRIFGLLSRIIHLKFVIFVVVSLSSYYARPQPIATGNIFVSMEFEYRGYSFYDTLIFSFIDYNYYRGLSKKQEKSSYASEHCSHPYLLNLAKVLDKNADYMDFSDSLFAEYLVAFVQQAIPYVADPWNSGFDYPKYPIETLVERGGDCEDKAALLVALLKTFGFDAVLVRFPGHMAAALSSSNYSGTYSYNGKIYSYIETTSKGWCIGCVPAKFAQTIPKILEVGKARIYRRNRLNN
jgi:hypothetical protein